MMAGNAQEQEQPPLDRSTPEAQASKEAAQSFQPVMVPDQENSRKTGSIHSQEEERVGCAHLTKHGGELVRKQHEKRHGNPTQAKRECQKSPQGFGSHVSS